MCRLVHVSLFYVAFKMYINFAVVSHCSLPGAASFLLLLPYSGANYLSERSLSRTRPFTRHEQKQPALDAEIAKMSHVIVLRPSIGNSI